MKNSKTVRKAKHKRKAEILVSKVTMRNYTLIVSIPDNMDVVDLDDKIKECQY